MRIEQSKPNITEYSFLRLLVSTLRSDYHEVIVAKHQLEKDLYTFYDDEDFNFLFEDVLKKESIEGNNYVDLSASFQMAYAWGLLSMIKDAAKDVRSVINLSEEEAIGNLKDYNEKQVNAMRELIYQIKEKEKTREHLIRIGVLNEDGTRKEIDPTDENLRSFLRGYGVEDVDQYLEEIEITEGKTITQKNESEKSNTENKKEYMKKLVVKKD